MKLVKRMPRGEVGHALPMALVLLFLGGLFVVPVLVLMTTSLKANMVVEENTSELYAADSGVEYGFWYVQDDVRNNGGAGLPAEGEDLLLDFPEVTINDMTVEVTISNEGVDGYKITSTAGGTTIESCFDIIAVSSSVWDYAMASLGGDIVLSGQSEIDSDEVLGGDIYANGDIILEGQAGVVNGDASATGVIEGEEAVAGEVTEGAPPLTAPEMDTAEYKAEAQAVDCAAEVHVGNWTPPAGSYPSPLHVQGNLTVSGSGDYTFGGSVCVTGDLSISSSAQPTFEGPVKVGGSLYISNSAPVTFGDTVYVEGNLVISSQTTVYLGGTVYVCGEIIVDGQADLVGGETVVAEGPITLAGQSQLGVDEIPFVVSTATDDPAITISGGNWTSAIVYAPNGTIELAGECMLYGAAVGQGLTGSGQSTIMYPAEGIGGRDDLPGGGGTLSVSLDIRTYEIE